MRTTLQELGLPEWQAKGLMEIMELTNQNSPALDCKDLTHFKTITGEDPTTIAQWIDKYGAAFKI